MEYTQAGKINVYLDLSRRGLKYFILTLKQAFFSKLRHETKKQRATNDEVLQI